MRRAPTRTFTLRRFAENLIPAFGFARTEQVASKKFLSALTALVSSPSTPPPVKQMVYRILSPLAYDAQSSPQLSAITKAFDSLVSDPRTGVRSFPNEWDERDPRWQVGGAPLEPDDPLFKPEALLPQAQGQTRRARERERERRFDGIEQMRDLRRRAVEGRGWAGMLCDAVANATDGDGDERPEQGRKRWEEMTSEEKEMEQARVERGEGGAGESERREGLEANEVVQVSSFSLAPPDWRCTRQAFPLPKSRLRAQRRATHFSHPLAQEIHAKLLETQEFLTSNLDWAAVQAAHSRAKLDASTPQPAPAPSPQPNGATGLASNNPFAAVVAGGEDARRREEASTEEEEILSELLSATTEVRRASSAIVIALVRFARPQTDGCKSGRTQVSDALALYSTRLSHSRTEAQEQADLLAAVERSKAENHVDRFRGHHEAERSRDYGEGGSGPRREEDDEEEGIRSVQKEEKGKGRARESLNPYAGYLVGDTVGEQAQAGAQADMSPYDGLDALEGLSLSSPAREQTTYAQPQANSAAQHRRSFSPTNPYASFASQPALSTGTEDSYLPSHDPFADAPAPNAGQTESAFLREYVPSQPSEKALGKLRRVSVGQSAFPTLLCSSRLVSLCRRRRFADACFPRKHRRRARPRPPAAPARGGTQGEVHAQLPRGAGEADERY